MAREINKLIIHCSDSDFGDVDTIRQWHLKRGFDDIGYHFVIIRDGQLQPGRPEAIVGAHCKGHNADSIGICLVGKTDFEHAQIETLGEIVTALMSNYAIPASEIYLHSELDNQGKTCPNPGAILRAIFKALAEREDSHGNH